MKRSATAPRSPRGPQHPLYLVYQRTNQLVADASNAREHSPRQIQQIARSMATFGPIVPLLVSDEGMVIAGHGRLLAARQLGLAELPTIRVSHLSDAERRAFMIADNRLTENSAWNMTLLRAQFAELSALDLDFDLEVTGFDLPVIDLMLQGESDKLAPDPDDAPIAPAAAVTRPGDIWQLGEHRIACGSALDPAIYAALMGGDLASMVFTDPPYNVPIAGHVSGLGKHVHREFLQASGEMDRAAFTDFLRSGYALMVRYSQDGSLHYVCHDWRHVCEFRDAAEGLYTPKNLIVWDKGTGGMGSLYRSQYELIWVFKLGKGAHTNNVQLGRFGRTRTNLWTYPGANSFARATDEGDLLAMHPTVKPVALVADAILDASLRGDLVLDPFAGSGTTIIAAERTGRVARAIELDPAYVDVAIRRYQRMTKRPARHAVIPCTFDELEEQGGRRG